MPTLEEYRPFAYFENSVAVPITVPQGTFVTVSQISVGGLPNGTYVINGANAWTASTDKKEVEFREVIQGVTTQAFQEVAGNVNDIRYHPYRTIAIVTDGTLNHSIEMQVETGGPTATATVLNTLVDYERKLEA